MHSVAVIILIHVATSSPIMGVNTGCFSCLKTQSVLLLSGDKTPPPHPKLQNDVNILQKYMLLLHFAGLHHDRCSQSALAPFEHCSLINLVVPALLRWRESI